MLEIVQATGLVKGNVNRWADFAQLGGANDVLVKHTSSWPKFQVGSDLDGSKPKPFWVLGSEGRYVLSGESVIVSEFVRGIWLVLSVPSEIPSSVGIRGGAGLRGDINFLIGIAISVTTLKSAKAHGPSLLSGN